MKFLEIFERDKKRLDFGSDLDLDLTEEICFHFLNIVMWGFFVNFLELNFRLKVYPYPHHFLD